MSREFAPGIPSHRKVKPIPKKRDQLWDVSLQRHDAERAGTHFDLRLSDGKNAYSWAIRKGLPSPGKKHLAIEQPTHTPDYITYSGEIEKGYGKGRVKVEHIGKSKIVKSEPNKVQFVLASNRDPEELSLIRTDGNKWLLVNHTETRDSRPDVPTYKNKYRELSPDKVHDLAKDNSYVFQPKIDGAHVIVDLSKNIPKIFSYRPSKRTNRLIQHTYKVKGLDQIEVPKELKGTILRGELYGEDSRGVALPSRCLNSLLNTSTERSIAVQDTNGVRLKPLVFDVEKFKGQDVKKKIYAEKVELLKEVAKKLPILEIPETATDENSKKTLFKKIEQNKHSKTSEGIVAWNIAKEGEPPIKVKIRPDHDVYIRDVFPLQSRDPRKGGQYGGFKYSYTPRGPVMGTVGTGFTEEERRQLRKWVGRPAKVRSAEKFPSGALRAPSFIGLHLEKEGAVRTSLQPHQQKVVERIKQEDQPGLVLYHGLGSGKTLSSIAMADALKRSTKILTPASLMANYQKEIQKHIKRPDKFKGKLTSIQKFTRDPSAVRSRGTLIVDEAHRLRDPKSSVRESLAQKKFDKRILLSASPLYNRPTDLASLVNIASGGQILSENPEEFERQYLTSERIEPGIIRSMLGEKPRVEAKIRNAPYLKNVLNKWVDYYESRDKANYPDVVEERVQVPMTSDQLKLYKAYFGRLPRRTKRKILKGLPLSKQEQGLSDFFFSSTRQLSNTPEQYQLDIEKSPKIQKVVSDTLNSPGKAVVYSNFIDSGLKPVARELQNRGVPFKMFTGGESVEEKKQALDLYNNDKLKALLISSSGAEGLDLKGTRQIQIMEPHWNDEKIEQVIGRGVRYKSHSHLPPNQRNVNVKRYLTIPSTGFNLGEAIFGRDMGTDEYLDARSQEKKEINRKIVNLLKRSDTPTRVEFIIFDPKERVLTEKRKGFPYLDIGPDEEPAQVIKRKLEEEGAKRVYKSTPYYDPGTKSNIVWITGYRGEPTEDRRYIRPETIWDKFYGFSDASKFDYLNKLRADRLDKAWQEVQHLRELENERATRAIDNYLSKRSTDTYTDMDRVDRAITSQEMDEAYRKVFSVSDTNSVRSRVEIILFDKRGNILVGKNARRDAYVLPGGGIEPGESPIEAAKRELKEETGKAMGSPRILGTMPFFVPEEGSSTIFVTGELVGGSGKGGIGADNDVLKDMKFVELDKAVRLLTEQETQDQFVELNKYRTDMIQESIKTAELVAANSIDPAEELWDVKSGTIEDEKGAIQELTEAVEESGGKYPIIIIGDEQYEDDDDPNKIVSFIQRVGAGAYMEKQGVYIEKDGSQTGTAGQLIMNEKLPEHMRDYSRVLDKRNLRKLLQEVAVKKPETYKDITHTIKQLGDREAVYSFGHLKYDDVDYPLNINPYLKNAKKKYQSLLKKYKNKDFALIDAYGEAKAKLNQDVVAEGSRKGNALAEMVVSGSRGNPSQLTDTIAGPLLVSDYKNKPIPVIIDRSYSQGLTPAQYWAASYGTRRGMISTKLAVPLAGHFSKMLSWSLSGVRVTENDCGTYNGVSTPVDDSHNIGKYIAKKAGGYDRNTLIDNKILSGLKSSGVKNIIVRSPSTCETEDGVCSYCLGNTESGGRAEIGYNAGLNSAAAMAEPVSQGMLSEKHTGGAVKKRIGGFPLIQKLVEIPGKFPERARLSENEGRIKDIKKAAWGGHIINIEDKEYHTPEGFPPIKKVGDYVEKGEQLTEGIVNPAEITKLRGIGEGRKLLATSMRDAFKEMGADLDRSHFEVAARAFVNFGRVEGDESVGQHLPGDVAHLSSLQKHVRFNQVGKTVLDPRKRLEPGLKLAKPALHYSVGTDLSPKVVKDLHSNGFREVFTTKEPMPFTPLMVRIQDTAAADKDWVTRLASQGLKKSLLEGVHRGHTSPIMGTSFVHPYVHGATFGSNVDKKLY